MTWEEFSYQFIETGWFDYDDRVKTLAAIRRVCERVPAETLEDLNVAVFAPSQHIFGQAYPAMGPVMSSKTLIYLSPDLEKQTQDDADFTVAHEFAHAVLGHGADWTKNGPGIEDEADELTVKWGFILPHRRQHGVTT